MVELRHCPQCNTGLSENAPSGLCPNCLLKLALESSADTLQTSGTSLAADIRITYFGDYELIQEIARGGMGVVYKARQVSLNRTVAIKMMQPGLLASKAEIERFRIEAEAAANLQHPNIVVIHEIGELDGLHYFSMDYVEGENLAQLVSNSTLPVTRAVQYVKIIAEAVHYAHQQGILHRDLKPSNILLDQFDQPRITDFGLAKHIESDSRLTATGAVLGTPSYMPPEQAASQRIAMSAASDVYSLGAILYELLTGRPPFQAATPLDTVMMVLNHEPVSLRMLNPKLDKDIETICLKCLEKDPLRRYQSAQELAEDLKRYLKGEPIKARPIHLSARAWRWSKRNVGISVAAVALFLLAVGATISAIGYQQRLLPLLLEQARLERISGNRKESLEKLAEAARIKKTAELKQEAINTITMPGLHLLHKLSFGYWNHPVFSPDSKKLAVLLGRDKNASDPNENQIKV
ncbi:MAG: serine/threonine-protein kinase, partial [Acidobacteriota bacterium]